MNEENKNGSWEFGILIAVGIIVAAVGVDLVGRLTHFLYGEWPYICIGLVLVAFFGVNVYVHSEFSNVHWGFQKGVDEKLSNYEEQLSRLKSENLNIRDEISYMRRSMDEHWKLCEKTILKAEKLLEQKSPIIKESVPSVQYLDQSVRDAVQEVVGGVI